MTTAETVTTNPLRLSKSKALADATAQAIEDRFGVRTIRKMATEQDMRRLRDREVRVWIMARRGELSTRAAQSNQYEVAIAVLDRQPEQEQHDIVGDDVLALAEYIADGLLGQDVGPDDSAATITGYEHAPLYDAELLQTHRVFAAGVALTLIRHEALSPRS